MSADALYTAPLSPARALLTSRRHIDLARVSSAGCR
ncbi:putative leader peptide [Streptomyces sp. SID3343]